MSDNTYHFQKGKYPIDLHEALQFLFEFQPDTSQMVLVKAYPHTDVNGNRIIPPPYWQYYKAYDPSSGKPKDTFYTLHFPEKRFLFYLQLALDGKSTMGFYLSNHSKFLGIDLDFHNPDKRAWTQVKRQPTDLLSFAYTRLLSKFTVLPSLTVESPHGLHLYWLLNKHIRSDELHPTSPLKRSLDEITNIEYLPQINKPLRVPQKKWILDPKTLTRLLPKSREKSFNFSSLIRYPSLSYILATHSHPSNLSSMLSINSVTTSALSPIESTIKLSSSQKSAAKLSHSDAPSIAYSPKENTECLFDLSDYSLSATVNTSATDSIPIAKKDEKSHSITKSPLPTPTSSFPSIQSKPLYKIHTNDQEAAEGQPSLSTTDPHSYSAATETPSSNKPHNKIRIPHLTNGNTFNDFPHIYKKLREQGLSLSDIEDSFFEIITASERFGYTGDLLYKPKKVYRRIQNLHKHYKPSSLPKNTARKIQIHSNLIMKLYDKLPPIQLRPTTIQAFLHELLSWYVNTQRNIEDDNYLKMLSRNNRESLKRIENGFFPLASTMMRSWTKRYNLIIPALIEIDFMIPYNNGQYSLKNGQCKFYKLDMDSIKD